jgi:hypothetical protein
MMHVQIMIITDAGFKTGIGDPGTVAPSLCFGTLWLIGAVCFAGRIAS